MRKAQTLLCWCASVLLGAASLPSHATAPLLDHYRAGDLRGIIEPVECCWLKLPPSPRLKEIHEAEMTACSAIGGPRGVFEHRDGKLWLTRLYRCGGVIELGDVYPGMTGPVVADWLNGAFKAQLFVECQDSKGSRFGAIQQQLQVAQGVVVSLTETRDELPACAR